MPVKKAEVDRRTPPAPTEATETVASGAAALKRDYAFFWAGLPLDVLRRVREFLVELYEASTVCRTCSLVCLYVDDHGHAKILNKFYAVKAESSAAESTVLSNETYGFRCSEDENNNVDVASRAHPPERKPGDGEAPRVTTLSDDGTFAYQCQTCYDARA